MKNASAKLTSCKITPEIFPPDPKYPLKRIGVVQGTAAPLGRATHSHSIAKYETIVNTTGTNMNGISKSGFITIGIPKVTISLILNIPGAIDNLPKLLIVDFVQIVTFQQLEQALHQNRPYKSISQNCAVIVFGTSCPA